MPTPETIFKPKYNGSMRFALLLWPVWCGLFVYFLYRVILFAALNPDAFLAFVFGAMTITLPFRVFREVRFGSEMVVKRYLQPDLVIPYQDITRVTPYGLWAKRGSLTLQMLNPDSAQEFNQIIQRLVSEKKIKLNKKS
jgi:hypothetical protein